MKNHYFDSDLFSDDGLMQRRANPFGWQQRPQRPRAAQPMRQPKPVPGPTSYGGINERAMQEADAPSGYFDPQPTDSDIMGGEIDPEIAGNLEAANSDYFAPHSQVSADDQIMGGSIDQTTARMAEDPYFGKPYNEDKDPPGHQQVAAAPEELKQATSAYADRIRKLRADRDAAVEAAGVGKKASVWNRIWKGDAGIENERSLKIANAEAVFQGGVNAANQELAAVHPEYFGKRAPEKPPEYDYNPKTNQYYRKDNPRDTVPGGAIPEDPKRAIDERKVANEEERIRLQAKRDADTAAYHDKWIGLQQAVIGARSAGDKAQAEARAGREIDRDIIKLESEKLKAVADAQFTEDKGASVAAEYDKLIAKAQAMRGQDAPTTSVAPPTGGGSGSPGPLAKVEKPAAAEGGEAILDAAPAGIKAKGYDKARGVYVGKGKDGKWVYWKG